MFGSGAMAQEPADLRRPSLNLFGVTGLIDMPSAQTQPDGQLSLTSSYFGGFMRNTLNFQILPRLEGTFRYSIIDDFFTGGGTIYDRSFDLKFRFSDETPNFPAVALGLQDMFGTGVYSGEYLVATKHLTQDLTLTGGLGWGRLSGMNGFRNPVTYISDGAKQRDTLTGNATGQVRFGQFFRGEDVALFGGLEWQTPVEGLSLKAEYSSDDYAREKKFSDFKQEIPFNFGIEYRPYDWLELGAYAMYGSEFGVRATFTGNPNKPLAPPDLDKGPLPIIPRRDPAAAAAPAPDRFGPVHELIDARPAAPGAAYGDVRLEQIAAGPRWATARTPGYDCPMEAARRIDAEYGVVDGVTFLSPGGAVICSVVLRPAGRDYLAAQDRASRASLHDVTWADDPAQRQAALDRLIAAMAEENLAIEAIGLEATRVHVEFRNELYNAGAQALGRAAVSLANAMPASVEVFELTLIEQGLPTVTVRLRRSLLEDQAEDPDASRRAWLTADIGDAAPRFDSDALSLPDRFPRFSWGVNPNVPVNMFDPDQPLRADLQVAAFGAVELFQGFSVNGRVSKRIVGNLDEIKRGSNSTLPHVRSDYAKYLRQGDPALERLTADYLFKLSPDVYGRLSAGYFEPMFGGLSAEVLWKPVNQSWGLGAEINYVKQRDFDQRFGFQGYDTVTGHASVYWQTGFFGLEAQVDAGRYLAEDWGATFSLTRRFSNGWEVGGFFTLTDVPFDEFGEGSFDKGIRLTIPFNWMLPDESRSRYTMIVRPLTRDGGARLAIDNRLWGVVRETDRVNLRDDWGTFWK